MLKSWKKRGRPVILASKYNKTFYTQLFFNPLSGKEIEFAMVDLKNWSMIMAVTDDHKVVVERQYRPGSNQISYSLPAGTADRGGEHKEDLIRRELEEETGYVPCEIIPLGVGYMHISNSPTIGHHFLGLNCLSTGHKKEDPDEEIEIELVPIQEWYRRVVEGEIDEPHSCLTSIRAMKHLAIKLNFHHNAS